jgi:nitroimidazol reductase NimA-like FMN-containing flavoprotein (pyridoxamine 5'-phosphate oxidase superfamily)
MLGQLNSSEIEALLKNNNIGRLGCNDGEKTYVVPVSYIYDNNTFLCHSRDGMKIEMMRRNPAVCFEVDEIEEYNHWRCVIAWGEYEELTTDEEQEWARQFFSEHRINLKQSDASMPPDTQQERFHDVKPEYMPAIYYKINLSKVTGRYEQQL